MVWEALVVAGAAPPAGDPRVGALDDPAAGQDGEGAARAARAVAGLAPVKRNRFIALDGAVKSVNRELEAKARTLAGIKGYVTNLAACPDGTPGHRGLLEAHVWGMDLSPICSPSCVQVDAIGDVKEDLLKLGW